MKHKTRAERKMWAGVLTVLLLTVCLAFTTYALVTYTYIVRDGETYTTGTIYIDLNDEQPIIQKDEFRFEPGVLVEKEFYLWNYGSGESYYRLYFDDIGGDKKLADAIEITITDPGLVCTSQGHGVVDSGANRGPRQIKGKILYHGYLSELVDKVTADDYLKVNECRHLYMYFHFPEELGNQYRDLTLSFNLKADAVQKKNNNINGIIDFGQVSDSN